MNDDTKPPIIVKRIKKAATHHHAGAWKIAYADFVTAMMAFFLLMWLLGSTTKGDLQGIAEYFRTPLKVALAGGSGSGDSSSVIQGGGTDLTRSAGQQKRGEKPEDKRTINLQAAQADVQKPVAVCRSKLSELNFKGIGLRFPASDVQHMRDLEFDLRCRCPEWNAAFQQFNAFPWRRLSDAERA